MHLNEWFEQWEIKPLLITTATNGLTYGVDKDKLLGYTVCMPEEDKTEVRLIKTEDSDLIKAQQYHGISKELMDYQGRSKEVQQEYLWDLYEKYTFFSYNCPFQHSFIYPMFNTKWIAINDLSVIEQAIRKEHAFTEEELATFYTFLKAAEEVYDPLSVNLICRSLNMTKQPSPGQLPMVRMIEVLKALYTSACEKDILLSQN